ncbi:hypothetical protein Dsin_026964 [Dipteronia sinensis]|uniref:HAT C-terminal dimerisation domain-containing protein n=1 Tax=Dipteronia sinensis TaxID=43782 RepID=A0AAD9ZZM3_9ROSI|nr:hypothetical protein Dsin_026964 [Dipteronia sinensis]
MDDTVNHMDENDIYPNNYCQRALNPAACRVPRTTLTETLKSIFEKEKKVLELFFERYNGRVSVCANIWKYNIDNKIFAIGFDDTSNNTAAIPALIELCKPYLGGNNLLSKKTKKLRGSFSSSSTTYSELESYLSTSFEFIEDTEVKKFDIIHWWNEHEMYFPILAMIAKQIISTPVSTVAVEQQFSAGGNILDPIRSLMSPKSLQMQFCVEDWTKAQYRQQEIDQEESYDFFKDDQPVESRKDDHDHN